MSLVEQVERKVYEIRSSYKFAEKSIDTDFKEIHKKTKLHYKLLIQTLLMLRHYNESQKKMLNTKVKLSNALIEISKEDIQLNSIATKYMTTCECLELGLTTCLTSIEDDIFLPLKEYSQQYKVIEERIVELKKRQIDMDHAHNSYGTNVLKNKPQQIITNTKTKYEQARDFYFYLRNEIIDDMKKLNNNYIKIVEPFFVKLFQNDILIRDIYNESLESIEKLLPSFKEQIVDVKWLITQDNDSFIHPQNIYTQRKEDITNGGYNMKANNMIVENAPIDPDYITDIPMMPPEEITQPTDPQQPSLTPLSVMELLPNNNDKLIKEPQSQPQKYKVLYDYETTEEDEISLKKDDIVLVHRKDGDWWEGEVNGLYGLVPSNFLVLLE
ncbi:proline-serine-threonine phosphatase interacting protein, putative [Entamoeba dispar SAW760]|uniref:Proline-serine-threonine phosphatase interacting protein, putative n=1 Tax=Entamoeba dispar (strain ATCC PRA-260 / SAW760) TaxID=370354 RepID=B0E6H1_ENTDS|nr:proline-serine-threonine phosphatase interacting protein, putative [Entamoeba dispar SAW760]EDR29866.1 proline-serine-threonine phosphatase interacting protein, putative [Entamoeba dispar SAW760]|eukprot:EDR29866.1 proline-serine-threonine phosphatase interacting protein, putative [Entamoeba dispar SAW760]